MTTTTIKITLEIDLARPVDELEAKVMGRAYTIDGVEDVRRLLDTGIEELEQENRLLRARNERLESEAKQQPAAQGGYAGITMWMGDRQITKHFTETMIKHAEVDVMEAEAKICIVNLKEGV